MLEIKTPTLTHCLQAGKWRAKVPETLRTTEINSDERQAAFYEQVILNNCQDHKYYSFIDRGLNVAFGGITWIEWENGIGEISLIVNPDFRNKKYGKRAVEMILDHAFNKLNLKTICGECYYCNSATQFWQDITEEYKGYMTRMPNRKFWNGDYYDSMYFSIDVDKFKEVINERK